MAIADAKKLIGRMCAIEWLARNGEEMSAVSRIHDVTYVPLYGGYIITDTEDVRLDRLVSVHLIGEDGNRFPIHYRPLMDLPLAA